MKGVIGIKKGISLLFDKSGNSIPITIIEFHENVVTKKLTKEKDGYEALQLSILNKKPQKCNKATISKFKKAGTSPKYYSREIRDFSGYELGDIINVHDIFKDGQYVDVTATSKGKGFSGSIKRHNFSIGPKSHGSGYHRGSGSMGAITQNRVFKQKKLPGREGHKKTTVQNLLLIQINTKLNYIIIKGSIPGPNNSLVFIKESVKLPKKNTLIDIFSIARDTETLESIAEHAKELHDSSEQEKSKEKEDLLKKEKQDVLNKERI